MIATKKFYKLMYYQKFLGLFLVLIGTPLFFLSTEPGSEMPLMVGLFTIFISNEKIEDERTVNLKTTSMYISFIVCYAIKLLSSNLYSHQLIPWQLVEINHFIILVFSTALIVYYFRMYLLK